MTETLQKPDSPAVAGRRYALVGKFAGMSKRDAQKLIRGRQGTVCERPDASVDFVVLGEAELPLGELLGSDDWLTNSLQESIQDGTLSVIGETELWQQLGLATAAADVDIRNLYTSAMLADLLRIPTATVRRWHRRGLITPKIEVRRLAYFDFQEVTNARCLVQLLAEGISPALLEKKLAALSRYHPGIQRRLAQLTVIVEGRDILLRQGDGLIDAAGQMRIDFDAPVGAAAAQSDIDEDATVLPAQTAACTLEEAADVEMSVEELMHEAALLEDSDRLADAATMYRTALAAFGPDAEVQFRLAELLYRMGDVSAARERYYSAIELDEDYVEARANLGCVLSDLGEVDLAIAAWQGALRFHPDYADVHLHLGRTLEELGRADEAVEHWTLFLQLAPESPWANEAQQRLAHAEKSST